MPCPRRTRRHWPISLSDGNALHRRRTIPVSGRLVPYGPLYVAGRTLPRGDAIVDVAPRSVRASAADEVEFMSRRLGCGLAEDLRRYAALFVPALAVLGGFAPGARADDVAAFYQGKDI